MDLEDEKKACQLFYGAFSIYEATEFHKAEWSQTGNPWWPLGLDARITCSTSEQNSLAGNICSALPKVVMQTSQGLPRHPSCKGVPALPPENLKNKTRGCFGNCSVWGNLWHIWLLLLTHVMCQITSPSLAEPRGPAWQRTAKGRSSLDVTQCHTAWNTPSSSKTSQPSSCTACFPASLPVKNTPNKCLCLQLFQVISPWAAAGFLCQETPALNHPGVKSSTPKG